MPVSIIKRIQPEGVRRSEADHRQPVERPSHRPRKMDDNNVRVSLVDPGGRRVAAGRPAGQCSNVDERRAGRNRLPEWRCRAPNDPPATTAPGPIVAMSPQRLYDAAESDYSQGSGIWPSKDSSRTSVLPEIRQGRRRAGCTSATCTCRPARTTKAIEAYDQAIRTYPTATRYQTPISRRARAQKSQAD